MLQGGSVGVVAPNVCFEVVGALSDQFGGEEEPVVCVRDLEPGARRGIQDAVG